MRSSLAAALCAALLFMASGPARAEGVSESGLRAAFLYYFLMYTEWPDLPDHYRICLLGRTDFEPALQALQRKEIAGRPIQLRHVDGESLTTGGCHLLYAATESALALKEASPQLAQLPVLTVTESGSSAARHAMLRIGMANGVLGFEADPAAARNAGLRFSAKLMRLARKTD